jgi:hypothetical protein
VASAVSAASNMKMAMRNCGNGRRTAANDFPIRMVASEIRVTTMTAIGNRSTSYEKPVFFMKEKKQSGCATFIAKLATPCNSNCALSYRFGNDSVRGYREEKAEFSG